MTKCRDSHDEIEPADPSPAEGAGEASRRILENPAIYGGVLFTIAVKPTETRMGWTIALYPFWGT